MVLCWLYSSGHQFALSAPSYPTGGGTEGIPDPAGSTWAPPTRVFSTYFSPEKPNPPGETSPAGGAPWGLRCLETAAGWAGLGSAIVGGRFGCSPPSPESGEKIYQGSSFSTGQPPSTHHGRVRGCSPRAWVPPGCLWGSPRGFSPSHSPERCHQLGVSVFPPPPPHPNVSLRVCTGELGLSPVLCTLCWDSPGSPIHTATCPQP